MRNTRSYICTMRHGGGFAGGYGGTYDSEHVYDSTHRAGSRANEEDAVRSWRSRYGRAGWCEVLPGTVSLYREA